MWNGNATFRGVVKKVESDEMYAIEAVYDYTSGRYQHVFLNGYKKAYGGYNLIARESLKKGDLVIVLQMRGAAWVYKARK